MLDRLDSIRWADLDLTDAAELPVLLRTVAAPPDEAARVQALGDLKSIIAHQGHAGDLAPLVLPFLFELIDSPDVPRRDALVVLVGDLAVTGDHLNWPTGWPLRFNRAGFPLWAGLHDAVVSKAPLLVGLLSSPDANLRAAAAFALAWLPEAVERVLPPLITAARDDAEALVRANALIAVGLLARSAHADVSPLFARGFKALGPMRVPAALCRAHATDSVDASTGDVLMRTVKGSVKAPDGILFAEGDTKQLAASALTASLVGPETTDFSRLWAVVDATAESVGDTLLGKVIDERFDPLPQGEGRRWLGKVSPTERAILTGLLDTARAGYRLPDAWYHLQRKGFLYLNVADLEHVLGRRQAWALDRELDGVPVWVTMQRAFLKGRADAWQLLLHLEEAELVPLIEEAISAPFQPWHDRTDDPEGGEPFVLGLADLTFRRVAFDTWRAWPERMLPPRAGVANDFHAICYAELLARDHAAFQPRLTACVAERLAAYPGPGEIALARSLLSRVPLVAREHFLAGLQPWLRARDDASESSLMLHALWHYADLCPTTSTASKLVGAVQAWTADQVVPVTRVVDLLAGMPDVARPLVLAALAGAPGERRDILECALAAMGG